MTPSRGGRMADKEPKKEALQPEEVPVTLLPHGTRQCAQCARLYAPKRRHQRFCSVACRVANFRLDIPPKVVKKAPVLRHGREAKDGLRCRICGEFIDNREGWRIACKSCSRVKMKAYHNPARCTRKGCVICMNATLAQSPEFIAAWEGEDAE